MARNTDERRDALRTRLTDIAERQIGTAGLRSLRARDLAAEAGCAVGAIYNAVGDLNELVLAVNARTFARLGQAVSAARAETPHAKLVAMAQAYHHFAAENHLLWRALFDIERPEGATAPDWYLAEMGRLFAHIAGPLHSLFPELDQTDHALLTRALFSAVHGIVLLGLDDASAGVPRDQIDRMLALTLERLLP